MDDIDRLGALHDAYVWEINAAVGEGRPDLVGRLADDYLDEALKLVTSGAPGCELPECAVCQRARPARVERRRHGWRRTWHRSAS